MELLDLDISNAFAPIYGTKRISALMGISRGHWHKKYADAMKKLGCVWTTHQGSRGRYRTYATTPYLINTFWQEYSKEQYANKYTD